jgi:MFS-type transporter involved in bile tolerance (Atg22 family)
LATGFLVVEKMVFLFFEFLGGSNAVCAITVALPVMFEIPMFQVAPVLLRKYGVRWLLLVANVALLVCIFGYTLIPQGHTWLVFLLEPLHGVTYAGSQSAAVEYVQRNMPRGSEASGQGIVNLIRGSGAVLGLWLGGLLMQESWGPRVMYRAFATTIAIGTAIFATVRYWDFRKDDKHQYERIEDVAITV